MSTINRDELVTYLDRYLRVHDIPDKSPNGLQVEGRRRVGLIAYAVDASLQTIEAAVKSKADMLVAHHGLWWGRHEQITGTMYRRVAALIRGGLSLYTAHLPLDCHPEVGNNVELARLLGLKTEGWFGEYMGTQIGVIAVSDAPVARAAFVAAVGGKLRIQPDVLAFGPNRVSRVGIVSGGGAMSAEEAHGLGCDTLLTGESSHSAYHPAREAGINVIYGGHYATETVGLKALDRHIKRQFALRSRFIPAPTGY